KTCSDVLDRLRGWGSRPQKQLRLCESLALGERRFLSVVECGRSRYLLGGTAASLTMLAALDSAERDPEGPSWRFVDGEMVRCT
ncbi:MAG TPA: flagellar biosynthetic protein FliO, partial [Acidobacteriaceae bacterium]|nr:flagellar biosynthetic protein FliO [Acidobacteriaceae bacterium]